MATTTKKTTTKKATSTVKLSDILKNIAPSKQAKQQYDQPSYTQLTDTSLMNGADLASMYGITFDRKMIEDIYRKATEDEYNLRYAEQNRNDRAVYDQLGANQASLLDALRSGQAQAITQGVNRGMQAASQLSALLGTSQSSVEAVTQQAQFRADLAKEKAAALSSNVEKALTDSNAMGMNLGNLASTLQANAVNKYMQELAYNQGLNTDYANVAASGYTADRGYDAALAQARANATDNYYALLSQEYMQGVDAANQTKLQQMQINAQKTKQGTTGGSAGGSTKKPSSGAQTTTPQKTFTDAERKKALEAALFPNGPSFLPPTLNPPKTTGTKTTTPAKKQTSMYNDPAAGHLYNPYATMTPTVAPTAAPTPVPKKKAPVSGTPSWYNAPPAPAPAPSRKPK